MDSDNIFSSGRKKHSSRYEELPERDSSSISLDNSSSLSSSSSDDKTEDATAVVQSIIWDPFEDVQVLTGKDRDVFAAAKGGHCTELKALLADYDTEELFALSRKYNVQGDTLLHIGVRSENESVLHILLDTLDGIDYLLYDILLLATKMSSDRSVEKIFEKIVASPELTYEKGKLASLPKWKFSEFDSYMSPLMLAAITGNYSLLVFFSLHGETLELQLIYDCRPRYYDSQPTGKSDSKSTNNLCPCYLTAEEEEEYVGLDRRRLHEYQAITSPAMLGFLANTLPSFDPLLVAFTYIEILEKAVDEEIEQRKNYLLILERLKEYTVQFVALCKSSHELELLFSQKHGQQAAHERYPRLSAAITMEHLDFVAHPNSQAVLYNLWVGNYWPDWRYLPIRSRVRNILLQGMFFPLYLLFVCGEQGNRFGRKLAAPMNRCVNYGISHLIFVALLLYRHITQRSEIRMPKTVYTEIAIIVFVLGHTKALLTQLFASPSTFTKVAWNFYDLITCSVFYLCIFCWVYMYTRSTEVAPVRLLDLRVPLERHYWSSSDPMLLADVVLALGTILACGRAFRYIQLHEKIGPALVALRAMMKNVLHFAPFFIILLAAFCFGLTIIYRPYREAVSIVENEEQSQVFTTYTTTLFELYWSLFGIVDVSADDIVHLSIVINGTKGHNHHEVTEYVGKILHATYCFLGTTILFGSIFIAYISNAFMNILEESKSRWRFRRAQIWIYYSRASVMPPPLNLLPTLWDVIYFFKMLRSLKRHPGKYALSCNCATCIHIQPSDRYHENEKKKEYFSLIKVLIQRYFRTHSSTTVAAPATCPEPDSVTDSTDWSQIDALLESIAKNSSGTDSKLGPRSNNLGDDFNANERKKPSLNLTVPLQKNMLREFKKGSQVDISRLLLAGSPSKTAQASPKPTTPTSSSPHKNSTESPTPPSTSRGKGSSQPKRDSVKELEDHILNLKSQMLDRRQNQAMQDIPKAPPLPPLPLGDTNRKQPKTGMPNVPPE